MFTCHTDSQMTNDKRHCNACLTLWRKIYTNRFKKDKILTAPRNVPIQWRYSESSCRLLFMNPIHQFYRTFIENEYVNTFRTKRIQCQTCNLDIPFESVRASLHTCFQKKRIISYNLTEKNDLSFKRLFKNKIVFLTCSRFSSKGLHTDGYQDLIVNHNHRYSLGLNFLNIPDNNPHVVHGQRYFKIGSLNSTIISSKESSKITYPFKCIYTHMNDNFFDSEHIYLCLRVVADFCASSYYFLEFIKSLTDAVRNKTSILLFNWSDETLILSDDEGVEIPLNDINTLLQHDTFFPLTTWLEKIKGRSPKLRLEVESNHRDLYAYRFIHAIYTVFKKRDGHLPANGRNIPPNP